MSENRPKEKGLKNAAARELELASALRANLRKRKDQQQAWATNEAPTLPNKERQNP